MLRSLRSILTTPVSRALRQTARLYHQNVVEHYENPRNVGE